MGVISHGIFRPLPGEAAPEDERPTLRTVRRPDLDEEEDMGEKRKCLVDGCDKDVFCRGLCQPHHDKLKNTVDFKEKYPTKHKLGEPEEKKEENPGATVQDDFSKTIEELAQKSPAPEPAKPQQNIPESIPEKRIHRAGKGITGSILLDLGQVEGLREHLEDKARREMRTLNSQILWELAHARDFMKL